MKLIIAGSRDLPFTSTLDLHALVCDHCFKEYPTEIVCGMARGPDLLGRAYGLQQGLKIKEFPADWDKFGKKAGFIRNQQMAEYADCLIALWDGKSHGTKDMIQCMLTLNKPFHVELCL